MPEQTSTNANPILIAAAWLVVILPTGWGLSYTVKNAMKLFTSAPPPAATTAQPAVAPR